MKTAVTVIGLSVLLSAFSLAQNGGDSTASRREQHQPKGFVDQNGDGVNDNAQQRHARMRRRTDRFIDANGDGISDGRECGLGFRRGAAAVGKGMGKQSDKKGKGGK